MVKTRTNPIRQYLIAPDLYYPRAKYIGPWEGREKALRFLRERKFMEKKEGGYFVFIAPKTGRRYRIVEIWDPGNPRIRHSSAEF